MELSTSQMKSDAPPIQTPAFTALLAVIERLTARVYAATQCFNDWRSPRGKICVPLNDAEGLLHEFCHWLVADVVARDSDDYGLDADDELTARQRQKQERQEKMCGWIEDALYSRAGVSRKYSSVDESDYLSSPSLKRSSMFHLSKISEEDQRLITEALRLPGGCACAYSDTQSEWPFTMRDHI